MYIPGRDKNGVPIIVVSFKGLDSIYLDESLTEALMFALLVVRKYMMIPMYIEKYHLIIDRDES